MTHEEETILKLVKELEDEKASTSLSTIIGISPLDSHRTLTTVQDLWNLGELELYDGTFHTTTTSEE